MSNPADEEFSEDPVGPFTGFGNFFRKELRDWWHSWRLILVFAIPALLQTLTVLFGYRDLLRNLSQLAALNHLEGGLEKWVATYVLLMPFLQLGPALYIFIVVFSTMGLLTSEKATGTLAWNLTKPLGRTGLFAAKWLSATLALWVASCVLPVLIATGSMIAYHGVMPDFEKMAPLVGIASAWIGLWVLLVLTISLGFQSQAAVGGIAIAFWLVPFLFGALMGWVFNPDTRDWILDRLAPRSPFWAGPLAADKHFFAFDAVKTWKTVWLYAFGIWTVVLTVFSLRVFSRQEIGS